MFTRYIWLYPLKRKSQVFDVFQKFRALNENKFQSKLKTLYTDNGGEYIGLSQFFRVMVYLILLFHHTRPNKMESPSVIIDI